MSTTTTVTETTTTTNSKKHSVRRLLGLGAVAGVAATVVNAVVYVVGNAAGVDYIAEEKASGPVFVQLRHVVSLSLISFAIGLAAAVVVTVLRRRGLRSLQVVGAVLGVATIAMDFGIDASAAAKITLGAMHLVVAAAYVAAVQAVRTQRAAVEAPATLTPAPVAAVAVAPVAA
jgi:hypothetical protein